MRLALVLFLAACSAKAPTYITTAGPDGSVRIEAVDDVEALAVAQHDQNDRCGGFMVHDSLADAELALVRPAPRPGPDYTIDRGALVRAALPALERERIRGTIRELSAMRNRYYQSTTGAAASEWLRTRWRSYTTREDVTVELVDHGYAQKSVILTIPGTTRANEVVVIGGHLDSIALGGRAAVARVLLANDYRPARTIKFMAYAAEEVGLRGSLSIARDFERRGVNVIG